MKPWLLVPLDDRPCCLQFPQAVAQLRTPPRSLLGWFQNAGDCDRLLDWLESEQAEAAGAIVSLDMLCWGGLVASRRGGKDVPAALARLQRLAQLNLPILAFQVIMRNAPTQTRPEEMVWAEAIVELSEAIGLGDSERELRLRAQIPADVLAEVLAARAENRQVYEAVRQHLARFEYCVFALDDSRRAGWNLLELQELGEVPSAPGTDETALLLCARAQAEVRELQVDWSHPDLPTFQGLYEDRELAGVLAAQFKVAGVHEGPSQRQLWLYGRPGQRQLEARAQQPEPPDPLWLDRLQQALEADQQVVLVDTTFANGGDLSLGAALHERGLWHRLRGYLAWNTLGNRLGTAVAVATLPLSSDQQQKFLWERVADDLLYQADYRWRAALRLLHPGLRLSESELESIQQHEVPELQKDWCKFRAGLEPDRQIGLKLPWHRLFEAEVELI